MNRHLAARLIPAALAVALCLLLLATSAALAVSKPSVTTNAATTVSHDGAALNGWIDDTGGENCDQRGFDWGTTTNYDQSWTEVGDYGTGEFSHGITGLSPGTTYHFRAKAHNSAGWSHGGDRTFTTTAEPTKYEYYDSGDDSAAQIYGGNLFAQTFTASSSHSVSSVKLKLYRVGEPGTATIYINSTNGDGHPTNYYYASGTINGNSFTADTGGIWYEINLTSTQLSDEAKYAIVLIAESGDSDNYICWRYDSADGYEGGNYEYSINGGTTWDADDNKDFMFEVWGHPTLEVISVRVFTSTMEDGDWLIAVHYKCEVPPAFPDENPGRCFSIFFEQDSADIAQTKLPAWGYKPASIYLSSQVAGGLDWSSDTAKVKICGNPDRWEDPPSCEYSLMSSDWKGAELFELDQWVMETAQAIGEYYGAIITVSFDGENTLTTIGGQIFLTGMAGLDKLRPHLFYSSVQETTPEYEETEWTGAQGESYEGRFMDNWVGKSLKYAGEQFHVKWNVITGIIVLGVIIALAFLCQSQYGTVKPVLIGGALVMLGGTVMGWIAAAIMAIVTILFALFLGYVWMFRHG